MPRETRGGGNLLLSATVTGVLQVDTSKFGSMPVLEDPKKNSLCHNHMITMAMGQWMISKKYKMADNGEKEC